VSRFPANTIDFSLLEGVQTGSRVYTAAYAVDATVYFPEVTWPGNEICHLPHLVLRLRISETVIALPYAFMECTKANLPLPLPL
jgi:hypothetical protein